MFKASFVVGYFWLIVYRSDKNKLGKIIILIFDF
jgi:hypothetical protein